MNASLKRGITSAVCLLFTLIHFSQAQSDSARLKTIELSSVQVTGSFKELSAVENLPVSHSVFSGYRLNSQSVVNTSELTARIPNLYMPEYGSKLTSPVYIRGIGSRINSPSVGLYVNDIPYFEKSLYRIALDEVKRIEVLRGPQGTLYGRNTMGGVINMYTYSPFDRQGTSMILTGGAFNDYSARLTHYALMGKKWGISLSAGYKHEGGYFRNTVRNEYAGKSDDANAGINLEYRPDEFWKISYTGQFTVSTQNGYPYAPFDAASNKLKDIVYNQKSGYDQTLTTHGLNIRRESDELLFTSVTAFQWFDDSQKLDQDFTADSVYFAIQEQKQTLLSQEIALRSNNKSSAYQWSVGAFGFLQNIDSRIDVDNYIQHAAECRLTDVSTSGAALFHQSKINDLLIEGLTLEGGFRIDAEKSKMDYDYSVKINDKLSASPRVASSLDFVKFIPRASMMYKHSDNTWFASFSYGYKTGGFNTAFELETDRSFAPENSLNYELGYRSSRIAGMFSAGLSLFHIDWKNQQIYATNPSGRGSVLRNAGESHSKGIEISLNATPLNNLSFDIEYGYTYAVFDKNVKNENEDYSGNYIPYVPRNTLSGTALYNIYLNGPVNRIALMAQYTGVGELFWDETNQSKQTFYGLLNAQAEFSFSSKYKLSLWSKNLLDTCYNVFDFKVGTSRFGQQGKPRTWGATLSLFI
jgi:outer membrane receptor protein involved in Fe transport